MFSEAQREAPSNTRALLYSLKILKDSILNGINLACYVWLSLEGLAWEAKKVMSKRYIVSSFFCGACMKVCAESIISAININHSHLLSVH